MTSQHACEEFDPQACSDAWGTFYRDRFGYGHWLCVRHRDLARAQDSLDGYAERVHEEAGDRLEGQA